MRFHTTVLLGGKTATGLPVPDDVVTRLGGGKKPPVTVTIGAYSYRSTIASRGEQYLIPLSGEHRSNTGLAAGDEVDVDVELDTAPRAVAVPPDLQAALDADLDAKATFTRLSYSHQLRHVLAIEGAKSAETRQRRIDKAILMLREGR